MKKAFVLLLIIIYNSGAFVASNVSKADYKTIPESNSAMYEILSDSISNNSLEETDLQKIFEKSNKMYENELFQMPAEEEKILKERSFIFIKQGCKEPQCKRIYKTHIHNLNKPVSLYERFPKLFLIPQISELKNESPPKKKNFSIVNSNDANLLRGYILKKYQFQKTNRNFFVYNNCKYSSKKAELENTQIRPALVRPMIKNIDEIIDEKVIKFHNKDNYPSSK